MSTLLEVRTDVQYRITDATGKFWDATMLNLWINQAMKDIARRTECLETIKQITAVPGQQSYDLPVDIFRVHRVEFNVTSGNSYLIQAREHHEMDSIWGIHKLQQQSYPSYYCLWGIMGSDADITFYPVPSQGGSFALFCYKLPPVVTADGDTCLIPIGWEDLIALYCEYVALRRDSDPRWQDAKSMYEEELATCYTLTRSHHDQQQWVTTPPVNSASWTWMGDEWGGY